MKKLLLLTLAVMLAVTTAQGKPSQAAHNPSKDQFKFGLHLKLMIGPKFGAFGEYKINEILGLQSGLLYFMDFYAMKGLQGNATEGAFVNPHYLAMPLILRVYPGTASQFCMFAGFQLNYLRGGNMRRFSINSAEDFAKSLEKLFSDNSDLIELKDASQHNIDVSNWSSHLVWGLDYEFLCGFQLGLEVGNGLTTLVACEKSSLNFTSKLTLGYNFAKLL